MTWLVLIDAVFSTGGAIASMLMAWSVFSVSVTDGRVTAGVFAVTSTVILFLLFAAMACMARVIAILEIGGWL